ncbi:MAG: DUF2171 domain-containing protein [Sphingomonadaceae bacterium]|nr:DUF2171 domain-containing protein [Sphingomonadaceae bacterium]
MGYERYDRSPGRRDETRGHGREPRGYGSERGRVARPSDYDYDDRDFFHRAGDEIRSWFGDEEAERRRRYDERMDARHQPEQGRDYGPRDSGRGSGRYGGYDYRRDFNPPATAYGFDYGLGFGAPYAFGGVGDERDTARRGDDQYRGWRERQLAEYDRDYDEFRRENQSRFDSEFGQWRDKRRQQRLAVGTVREDQEVVGSDGEHVGKVDYIKGERIILARQDPAAGGQHHSIPSSWVDEVSDKVTLNRTADEAKRAWREADEGNAMFGGRERGPHMLNRSFSGTYDE